MAFCKPHSLVTHGAVRHGIHIVDLINTHSQDLVQGGMESGDRPSREMLDPGIQLCLSLDDTFQQPLDKSFLHCAHTGAVIERPSDKDIAECLILLMRKKGKQNNFSLVLHCPSFFACMYGSCGSAARARLFGCRCLCSCRGVLASPSVLRICHALFLCIVIPVYTVFLLSQSRRLPPLTIIRRRRSCRTEAAAEAT